MRYIAAVAGSRPNLLIGTQSGPVQRAMGLTDSRIRMAEEPVAGDVEQCRHGVSTIASYLRRAIETGAYSEGDRLPPERQLAMTFDAARSTVRRALDQLERAGLVSRRLGSGTYVGSGGGQQAADLADQISPLQLIEAR